MLVYPSLSGNFFMDDGLKKYRSILIEGFYKAQDSVFKIFPKLFSLALTRKFFTFTSKEGR
jgi:hypothetical protein